MNKKTLVLTLIVFTFVITSVAGLFFASYYNDDRDETCLKWERTGFYLVSNFQCIEWSE